MLWRKTGHDGWACTMNCRVSKGRTDSVKVAEWEQTLLVNCVWNAGGVQWRQGQIVERVKTWLTSWRPWWEENNRWKIHLNSWMCASIPGYLISNHQFMNWKL